MERANLMLKELVGEMNKQLDGEKVFWLDAPGVKKEEHLVDHAHLNEEGYRIWDEVLYPKIIDLLT
jgi:lysophospholipase L1-like esterase